ncbi:MAG: hypothetical protein K2I07_09905, partial [Lachnospiraceae bacterium]|nr:hypothetical protein [Lachnospiraceae bacterium]
MRQTRKKAMISIMILLFGSILLLVLGAAVFREKRYAWISLGIAVLSCAVMLHSFDRRHTHIRRLVFVAVM